MTESPPRVLDLRSVFGVRATVTVPAESTDGERVEMECVLDSGHGSMIHYHPEADESYEVLSGTIEIWQRGHWKPLTSGERLEIPRGSVHGFRNRSGAPVHFRNTHRPALGFQAHLETIDRLARSGRVRGTKDLRSLMHLALSAERYKPDVPVRPPLWVIKLLAAIGRRLGYSADTPAASPEPDA